MPARSFSVANSSFSRRESASHCASVSSLLDTFENCSASGLATRRTSGMRPSRSSAVRRPPARLDIVPPVATSRTRGSSCAAATSANARAISRLTAGTSRA